MEIFNPKHQRALALQYPPSCDQDEQEGVIIAKQRSSGTINSAPGLRTEEPNWAAIKHEMNNDLQFSIVGHVI